MKLTDVKEGDFIFYNFTMSDGTIIRYISFVCQILEFSILYDDAWTSKGKKYYQQMMMFKCDNITLLDVAKSIDEIQIRNAEYFI